MNANFDIDTQELVQEITQEVLKGLEPYLNGNGGDDGLFTVKTLSEYLHVKTAWVYQKVHEGEIPHYKVGKYPRFRKFVIDEWLKKSEKGNGKTHESC